MSEQAQEDIVASIYARIDRILEVKKERAEIAAQLARLAVEERQLLEANDRAVKLAATIGGAADVG